MKIKRLLCAFCALSLCVIALASCNKGPDIIPDHTILVTNDAVDFSFCCPDTWKVFKNEGMIAVKPNPGSTGIAGASISVSAFELKNASSSVHDYWKEYEGSLKETFRNYEFLNSKELKLADAPAERYDYKGDMTGTSYRFSQVFCIRNGTVYQITMTATDEDYQRYSSALDTVTAYFKFK